MTGARGSTTVPRRYRNFVHRTQLARRHWRSTNTAGRTLQPL